MLLKIFQTVFFFIVCIYATIPPLTGFDTMGIIKWSTSSFSLVLDVFSFLWPTERSLLPCAYTLRMTDLALKALRPYALETWGVRQIPTLYRRRKCNQRIFWRFTSCKWIKILSSCRRVAVIKRKISIYPTFYP